MKDQEKSKAQLVAELEELREQVRSQEKDKESAIQVEEAVRTNDTRFRTIYDSAPLLMNGFDQSGRCILWNKECEHAFGWTMDEINSYDDPLSLFYPDPQLRDEVLKSVTSSPGREFREWHPLTKDGATRTCLWANILLPDGTVMNLGQDITDQKKAEEELDRIFELSPDLIGVADANTGYFKRVNSAWSIFGRPLEEFTSRPFMDFIHPDDQNVTTAEINQQQDGESIFGFVNRYRCLDGSYKSIEWRATHVQADGTVYATGRDITERNRAEEELRVSEERFREMAENIGEVFWLRTPDEMLYVSPAYEEIWGRTCESLLQNPNSFIEAIHPDDQEHIVQAFQSEMSAAMDFDEEYRIVRPDGSIRWIWARSFHIESPDAQAHSVGIAQDITERIRMEEELLKVEKLESIGVLAGGIAHDLNNYLTGIVGNIGLAMMYDDPVDKDKRLAIAEEDAMRVKELTQRLLTFSKGGLPVRKPTDLVDVIREAADFTLSGSNVGCNCVLPNEPCLAEIDAAQIRQVINNLVINAQQAMPEGGKIKVSAEKAKLGKGSNIPLPVGQYVKVSVQDSGIGIPKEDLGRIFDPFFSTKPKGNGLGLATSFSIIQKHDGYIMVESELGVGSTFEFYLPASSEELTDRKDKDEEETESQTGAGRILVMDDQEHIRDIVEQSLSKLGYTVVTCTNGSEAIEKYQDAINSEDPFQAVILDLTIPGGMGGKETITRLKEVDPSVTAIVASGYADDPVVMDYREYGFTGAIAKPYRIRNLAEVLHEALRDA